MDRGCSFDPLLGCYVYARRFCPGSVDQLGGEYGVLSVDGVVALDTWAIDSSEQHFEADPCGCGVYGCGLLQIHVHRSGPYLALTCWRRRDDAPEPGFRTYPLVLGAERYQAALGGALGPFPLLDAVHARLLLGGMDEDGDLEASEALWWEGQEPEPIDARQLRDALLQRGLALFEGASLVGEPEAALLMSGERADNLLSAGLVDGAIAVRLGELWRFPVWMRLPALRALSSSSPPAGRCRGALQSGQSYVVFAEAVLWSLAGWFARSSRLPSNYLLVPSCC
jgi:hypothetical protein